MDLTITQPTVTHNTFVLERSYPATPERVFAAFADPAKKRRWFVEGEGHDVDEFAMDFRVGGSERARFRLRKGGPLEGAVLSTDALYQDIVPNRRVVMASTMSLGGQRISATLATFELLPEERGTRLVLTHQAAFFEGADGPQLRERGWRQLLERLGAEFADQTASAP